MQQFVTLDLTPEIFVCMRAHVCVYSLSACPGLNLCIIHYCYGTLLYTYLFYNIFILCLQGHLPSSCQDVQSMNGPLPDSEHVLSIQGKAVKVSLYDLITSQMHKVQVVKP